MSDSLGSSDHRPEEKGGQTEHESQTDGNIGIMGER
jgi:hypothetical protein